MLRIGAHLVLRSRLRLAKIASALLLTSVAMAGLGASAQAANYTVGTLNDLTGTCPNPASGTCSLRQLIDYENELASTPSPPDGIVVPGGKYDLSNGALLITQTVAIVGAGARTTNVDVAGNAFPQRVFEIKPSVNGGDAPSVVITGLEISGGIAGRENGSFGGDVYNSASLVLSEDWITGGTAESGGGISNDTGTLVIQRSLVSANHASNGGGDSGGIQNHGSAGSPGKKGVLAVEDSTIAENDARLGAAIFSWADAADGNQVTIINSTIAYNSTRTETGGTPRGPGGGLLIADGAAQVTGSILAYNSETFENYTPTNCSTEGSGTITSLGYNLETETDCGFTSTEDIQNAFNLLSFTSGTPQNNGGNTDTLALEPTSAGVDAIPTSNPFCSNVDQRGVTRPQGVGCDMGAVEIVPRTIQATEGAQFSGIVATSTSCGIESTPPPPTVEWGDGKTSEGTIDETGSSVGGSHTYPEEGTYTGAVTYHNDCGTHKVAFLAQVADARLTATGVPLSATADAPFSATLATFTDADPAGTASDYTATISWGDGTTTAGTIASAPGGEFTVTGSHAYPGGGVYPTDIAISDAGGANATATGSVNVPNPPSPPTAPPSVLPPASPPAVLTTTSAAFTTTVNPHGLPTSVHFEYGPVLPGASTAAITYGSVTPDQAAGSDFSNHTISTTVTGLLPNVTYHVRAVASNSAGSTLGVDQTLKTPADPPPPPPVLGKSVNVSPVSGIVYIELPPGATLASFSPSALPAEAFAALTKGLGFIPLTEARQIPVGSILDATAGVASITTAAAFKPKQHTQSGDFGAGIFKLLQQRRQRGLTELNIIDNHSARTVCATSGKGKQARAAASHPSSKVLGHLRANSHGHFSARGQFSAATVRGTIWGVFNRCDGTLTRVTRGKLTVRDFHRRKTITLFTGQSYLARAR